MSIPIFLGGIFATKLNFILAAAGVCVIMAVTLILIWRNIDHATEAQRKRAGFWTALVAGVGVWATHFVAMLGYRPDMALTYNLEVTLLSIVAGFVCVSACPSVWLSRSNREPIWEGLGPSRAPVSR